MVKDDPTVAGEFITLYFTALHLQHCILHLILHNILSLEYFATLYLQQYTQNSKTTLQTMKTTWLFTIVHIYDDVMANYKQKSTIPTNTLECWNPRSVQSGPFSSNILGWRIIQAGCKITSCLTGQLLLVWIINQPTLHQIFSYKMKIKI